MLPFPEKKRLEVNFVINLSKSIEFYQNIFWFTMYTE